MASGLMLASSIVIPSAEVEDRDANTPGRTVRVWRSDQRDPADVFSSGFSPNGDGTNTNILEHISGVSIGDDTNFVSTTTDINFARDWQANAWVYEIVPGADYVDVVETFRSVVNSVEVDEAVRTEAERLLHEYGYQGEWAAVGDIPRTHIESATPVIERDGEYVLDEENRVLNVVFDDEVAPRPARVLEAGELSLAPCTASARARHKRAASCGFAMDPDVLRERHQAAWEQSGADADLSMNLSELASGEHAISPLPESISQLQELTRGSSGVSDTEWVKNLSNALDRDLEALEGLSSSARLLDRVAEASGRALSAASELLPYAGIAATAYAIEQDVQSSDYVDLAFDGIAEGLQVAEALQPEFTPFIEVALVADIVVQQVVDFLRNVFGPHPTVAAWQQAVRDREKINRQAWDDAPATLRQHYREEVETRMTAQLADAVRSSIGPRVDKATKQDLRFLDRARLAARTEVFRATFAAQARGTAIVSRSAALRAVDEAFARRADERVRARGRQLLSATEHAAALVLDDTTRIAKDGAFRTAFLQEVATPFVQKLSDNLRLDFVYETRPPRTFNPDQRAYLDKRYAEQRQAKLNEVRSLDLTAGLTAPDGRPLAEDVLADAVLGWSQIYAHW